jgi:hypothetical protein
MKNPIADIANQLVPHLAEWTLKPIKPDGFYAEFVRADHAEITIQVDRSGKMYHIAGGAERPIPNPPFDELPRINVNRRKTAAQIAKDIRRRVIPKLDDAMPLLLERKRRSDEHENLNAINAERLAPLLGNKEPYREPGYYTFTITHAIERTDRACYARVAITGDRIKLELDQLTIGETEAILRIVNGLPPFPARGTGAQ